MGTSAESGEPGETGETGETGDSGHPENGGEAGDPGDPGETGQPGDPAEPAAREAVRTAEQTVGDAWIGHLLIAEHEASLEAAECLRVCCRLAERLRASRGAGDAVRTDQLRARLDRADRRSAVAMADYDGVRDLLVHELQEWAQATRVRKAASRGERGCGDD